MPKVAPKPPAPQPRQHGVRYAGTQEQFTTAADELAAKLGFVGADDLETEQGLSVRDARNYIVKVMHEHYQAAARGEAQPDYKAACEHLGVDDADEQAAIDAALAKAYEDGKSAEVKTTPALVAGANATLSMGASAGLDKLANAEAKARK